MQRGAGRSTILAALALAVASAALGVTVYLWWDSRRAIEYTIEQQTAARDTACTAYGTVRTGVDTNTNLTAPDATVTGSMAAAANARLALIGGGQYLLSRVGPATPAELAEPMSEFANTLMDFGVAATAGALNTDPAQESLLQSIDVLNNRLGQLCG